MNVDCINLPTFLQFILGSAEEIKKAAVNGFSVTCLFALDDKATIRDVRKKNKNLLANSEAHKMPVRLLEPSFVVYVGHCKCLGSNVPTISKTNNCYTEELADRIYLLLLTAAQNNWDSFNIIGTNWC